MYFISQTRAFQTVAEVRKQQESMDQQEACSGTGLGTVGSGPLNWSPLSPSMWHPVMRMNVKCKPSASPLCLLPKLVFIPAKATQSTNQHTWLCCEQIQNSFSALCITSSGSTGVLAAAGNSSPYPLPALASPLLLGDRGAELAMCITLAQVKATPGYCPALGYTYGYSKMLFRLSARLAAVLAL